MIPFLTLTKREILRFLKLMIQTIFPPILSALLFIFIFGYSLGSRITEVNGFSYIAFIIPGLVMMNVIFSAYNNTSSSLLLSKMLKNIEDILIAPLSYFEIALAMVLAGVVRGLIVGTIIIIVALLFTEVAIFSFFYVITFMILVSIAFASFGLIAGIWAERFDQVMLFNTFIITPLTFLGGVFYSIDMLPGIWRQVSFYNPIFYMINGLRYGMIGIHDFNPLISLIITLTITVSLFIISVLLLKSGYKLRT